ncbi:hypothetical protein [Spongiivirga citrea]|uniref:DUF3278 domain-containing protein n=1 Tax=Spongiivirga citrea TaxID=1481457 RepID=A0A6M0CJH7_9FLAO|nr:hypothetical protein [Spongiivirga citrea]NER18098.1 hypothetical protein [Spongiivirga citrea]
MNIDEIKSIWKKDMEILEKRVKLNEEKIKTLEFNKAKTGFDELLKISIAGKNMAIMYAIISLIMIFLVTDSLPYMLMLLVASGAMVFSYFQHRVLKKVDYGKLSLIDLQKEIIKFRMHTARTGIYDLSIVVIWLVATGLAFVKFLIGFDVFHLQENTTQPFIIFGIVLLVLIIFTKMIYGYYDKRLKKYEDDLGLIKNFEGA